ncbi:hypothetical protein [Candidatus Laterigemmans baculatus]|uniref:hypothetical protein n=1 Tax=Candidatus Laterigemmans baculatus TaxID=2770505 RepID=UPI00193C1244|nr:hypothetical protein [Candidatus Laterigemmans baculatus]
MFLESDHRHADSDLDADPTSSAALIDHDTLAEWKAEIRDFFARTGQRLNQFQVAPHPSETDPNLPADTATKDSVTELPPTSRAADEGSLDRLQIIKNRLAAQLENSRR